jgi:hypothetical protein
MLPKEEKPKPSEKKKKKKGKKGDTQSKGDTDESDVERGKSNAEKPVSVQEKEEL